MNIDLSGKQIGNIVMDSTFTTLFALLMIFIYGRQIQELIITTQTDFLIDALSKDLHLFSDQQFISNLVKAFPETPVSDEYYKSVQSRAFNKMILIVAIGFAIAIAIAFVFSMNITTLIASKLLFSFTIVLVAYLLITFIGRNFILIDPNLIRYRVLSILQAKIPEFKLPSLDDIKKYLESIIPPKEQILATVQSLPQAPQIQSVATGVAGDVGGGQPAVQQVSSAVQPTVQTTVQTTVGALPQVF
jgi:hypothetical protein